MYKFTSERVSLVSTWLTDILFMSTEIVNSHTCTVHVLILLFSIKMLSNRTKNEHTGGHSEERSQNKGAENKRHRGGTARDIKEILRGLLVFLTRLNF